MLDGEIVHLGSDGKPQFSSLMRHRGPQHFFAFDLLWLDGRDLRGLPLLERKGLLRGIVPQGACPVLYVDHVAEAWSCSAPSCEQDMEGIVAKRADGLYTPGWDELDKDQEPRLHAERRAAGVLRAATRDRGVANLR